MGFATALRGPVGSLLAAFLLTTGAAMAQEVPAQAASVPDSVQDTTQGAAPDSGQV